MKKFLMVALCLGMAACTSKTENEKKTVNFKGTMNDQSLPAADRAEKIAEAGEELMGNPAAFMYADQIFDLALTVDANNKRAQMYKALNAPLMSLKGILTRVKPLVTKYPGGAEGYNNTVAQFKNDLPPRVFKFLSEGSEDIKDEKGIQSFIEQWQRGFGSIRTFFKANKSLDLNVVIPATLAFGTLKQSKACDAQQINEYEFEYTECPGSKKSVIQLNRADSEAVQQYAALFEIGLILYNAYDLSGAIDVSKQTKDQGLTNSEVYKLLAKNSDFAKVRNKAALSSIVDMGIDGLAAVRYALANQKELCPTRPSDSAIGHPKDASADEYGYYAAEISGADVPRRPGTAFEKGFCLNDVDSDGKPVWQTLAAIEQILRGDSMPIKYWDHKSHELNTTLVKPTALLLTPVMDLKTLSPSFNACGDKVVSVSDKTLGGLFPQGDANSVLRASDTCSSSR